MKTVTWQPLWCYTAHGPTTKICVTHSKSPRVNQASISRTGLEGHGGGLRHFTILVHGVLMQDLLNVRTENRKQKTKTPLILHSGERKVPCKKINDSDYGLPKRGSARALRSPLWIHHCNNNRHCRNWGNNNGASKLKDSRSEDMPGQRSTYAFSRSRVRPHQTILLQRHSKSRSAWGIEGTSTIQRWRE